MFLHRKVFQNRNFYLGIEFVKTEYFGVISTEQLKKKQIRKTSFSEFSYSFKNSFVLLKYIILT